MNLPTIQRPAWWQQLHWIIDPIGCMETAANRYGDRFIVYLGNKPYVFVSHPEALQQIFSRDSKALSSPGEENAILKPLTGDTSIFLADGKTHRSHRK